MKNIDRQIQKINKTILKLNSKIERIGFKRPTNSYYRKLLRKRKRKNESLNDLICQKLEQENKYFAFLAKKNYELIAYKSFNLKITELGVAPFNMYEKKMQGFLHDNGFIYLQTIDLGFNLLVPFRTFPILLEGKINPLGNLLINVRKKKSFPAGLPKGYLMEFEEQGYLRIKPIKYRKNFLFVPPNYAYKLMGSPFKKNKKDFLLFMENRKMLLKIITEYKRKNNLFIK